MDIEAYNRRCMHLWVGVHACVSMCVQWYSLSDAKPRQISLECPTHSLITPSLALPPSHFRLMKMMLNRRHTTEKMIPTLARTVITENRMTFMVVTCGLGMPPESRRQVSTAIMRVHPMYIRTYAPGQISQL